MTNSLADDQQRLYVAKVSLVVGIFVMGLKFYAYHITGSQAVLSDALESIINVFTASMVLMTIRLAIKPADKDHPYGHGKVEFFSSAFEGALIAFAAIYICISAFSSMMYGHEILRITEGVFLVIFAGACNFALGLYLLKRGRQLHSIALESSGSHILSDVWTSVGLMVGLMVVKISGWNWLDAVLALGVGVYLAYTGLKIIRKSIAGLMDEEDPKVLQHVASVMHQHMNKGIIDIHEMRVIRAGRLHHLDMHVILPEFWTIDQAHDRLKQFEHNVFEDYTFDGQMHYHYDPCRQKYCEVCDLENCSIRQKDFNPKESSTDRISQSQSDNAIPIDEDVTKNQ